MAAFLGPIVKLRADSGSQNRVNFSYPRIKSYTFVHDLICAIRSHVTETKPESIGIKEEGEVRNFIGNV